MAEARAITVEVKPDLSMCERCFGNIKAVIEERGYERVRHGYWKVDKYTRTCSVCGKTYWMRAGDVWHFCPECGAKNGGNNGND